MRIVKIALLACFPLLSFAQESNKIKVSHEIGFDLVPISQLIFKSDISGLFGIPASQNVAPSISYRLHYKKHAIRVRYFQNNKNHGEGYTKYQFGNTTNENWSGFNQDRNMGFHIGYQYQKDIGGNASIIGGIEGRFGWMQHKDRFKSSSTTDDGTSVSQYKINYENSTKQNQSGIAGILGLQIKLKRNCFLTFETAFVKSFEKEKSVQINGNETIIKYPSNPQYDYYMKSEVITDNSFKNNQFNLTPISQLMLSVYF